MKPFLITLILLGLSFPVFSETADVKSCVGTTQHHVVNFEQIGKDIQGSVEDKNFNAYRDIGNASEGKFKASGKEKSTMILHSIELQTFMKSRTLSVDFMVALILGRPEFRGEEDMIYSYAEEFIRSLSCK